jgi:hypothetical protein
MTVYEFKDVKIDGNKYDLDVHGLANVISVYDHHDEYCFGAGARVIIEVNFECVIIHAFGSHIDITPFHADWQSIKKQVAEHILDDHEFMREFQDKEFSQ